MHFVVVISIISIDPWSVREMFPCPMMLSLISTEGYVVGFFNPREPIFLVQLHK